MTAASGQGEGIAFLLRMALALLTGPGQSSVPHPRQAVVPKAAWLAVCLSSLEGRRTARRRKGHTTILDSRSRPRHRPRMILGRRRSSTSCAIKTSVVEYLRWTSVEERLRWTSVVERLRWTWTF